MTCSWSSVGPWYNFCMSTGVLLIAILGGILPALIWLFFWLMEDRCEPEPKRYIFLCFLGGMLCVLPALIIEKSLVPFFTGSLLLVFWAATEELLKFGAAYVFALRWAVFDEPLDAIVYMVTTALGFSAMENALFLLTPLSQGDVLRTIVTGDLRFIGAMLLHTLASSLIGLSLALAYYKPAAARKVAALVGVILAVSLHSLFNIFILNGGGSSTFAVFLVIWCGVVGLLFMVERIKQPARDYC
jgi:RsiW-degrading membrane proteinase PrsW (M82 family)